MKTRDAWRHVAYLGRRRRRLAQFWVYQLLREFNAFFFYNAITFDSLISI